MKDNLLISIIIPTYNRESFITKTIDSVLKQSDPDFEVLIVDDGSSDNTEETVKKIKDSRIRYYKIPNGERGHARNYGTNLASGNYVTFLDSDDLLYPDYLSNAKAAIKKFQQPPFFHQAYEIKDEKGKVLYSVNNLKPDDVFIITKGNPLSCMGVFIRKDISEKFKFNEDRELAGSEDWELWLRIIANCGIKTDNKISACLFHHDQRSVLQFDETRLFTRKELALKYAFKDPRVREIFGKQYKKIDAYADSYISLHLALAGNNKKSIKYLLQAFGNYPLSFFSKRTIAIFKHILLNLLSLS